MQQTDDLSKNLRGMFFKNLIESSNNSGSAVIRLAFSIIGLLAIIGVEGVKIIFRKNFGSKEISIIKILFCCLFFGAIGIWGYRVSQTSNFTLEKVGSQESFLTLAIFYIASSSFILIKGIIEMYRASDRVHAQYRGDSVLLSFLMKKGWSQASVQNFFEPVCLLFIALFLSYKVNWLLGVPLAFCALSVWIHLLMELSIGVSPVRNKLAEYGYDLSKQDKYVEVKN